MKNVVFYRFTKRRFSICTRVRDKGKWIEFKYQRKKHFALKSAPPDFLDRGVRSRVVWNVKVNDLNTFESDTGITLTKENLDSFKKFLLSNPKFIKYTAEGLVEKKDSEGNVVKLSYTTDSKMPQETFQHFLTEDIIFSLSENLVMRNIIKGAVLNSGLVMFIIFAGMTIGFLVLFALSILAPDVVSLKFGGV